MSGPWDRPSPPDGEDAPREEPSEAWRPRQEDPWSAHDPWAERPSHATSGWDDWPSSTLPPDEYDPEPPQLPASDPWAESWKEDEPSESEYGAPDSPGAWSPPRDVAAEPPIAAAAAWSPPVSETTPEPEPPLPAPWPPLPPQDGPEEPLPASTSDWQPGGWAAGTPEPWPMIAEESLAESKPAPEPEPEHEPEPETEPEPEPEPEPEGEPEPVQAFEPASGRAPESAPAPEPEPEGESVQVIEPEPMPSPLWEPDAAWVAAAPSATGALPEPTEIPEPEPLWAPDQPWQDQGEVTQVLPRDWKPEPPARTEPGTLEPAVGPIRVSLADTLPTVPDTDGEDEPSTAEQAVPWLIGVILLLAGMVIVLLALIFAGDASLGSSGPSPSATALLGVVPSVQASATLSPSLAASFAPSTDASPSAQPTPSPTPMPEYGQLEMLYQGRSAALEPIYLLHRDFTTADEAVLAQDPELDVRSFAWAPDGTVGAALLADVLVSIEIGKDKRTLGNGISTVTFGDDASTVYAVRVVEDGANDVATALAVDFASGDARELARASYPRPDAAAEEAAAAAQFIDEGGPIRLYWLEDDTLRLWVLGGGTWDIDPKSGEAAKLPEADVRPALWGHDGEYRIQHELTEGVTKLTVHDPEGGEVASTQIEGRVSHLRWSPDNRRVVFTLGKAVGSDGVVQDLYLWDLNDQPPMRITDTGANFGAEWRGTQPLWRGS